MRFPRTEEYEVDLWDRAIKGMMKYSNEHSDGNDGSRRLYAYAGICKFFDFDADQTVDLVREMEKSYPFPREYTDDQIRKRWADNSLENGNWADNSDGGAYQGQSATSANGKASKPNTADKKDPPTEADLAHMFDDAADVCRSVVTGILNGEADKLFDCGPAFPKIEIGPGLLKLIGAPPGRGKTALAMELTYNAMANEPDLPVVVASLEMSAKVLIKRHLAGLAGVSYDAIRFNTLTTYQRQELANDASGLIQRIAGAKFVKQDFCGIGDLDLWRQVTKKPGLLVLDYLQLFGNAGDDAKTRSEQTMAMASRYCADGWGVICVSALNRAGYNESSMAAFRDSNSVEYGASSAYLLNEATNPDDPDREDPIQWLRLECVKNRHGAKRSYDLYFNGPQMSFSERNPFTPPPAEREAKFDQFNAEGVLAAEGTDW
ncbi:DnaB-like helicase C-terminal domain-containing protein [Rhodopirellula sp. JC639]|uniref:DnaB-like helicase C-terminal domain-containing protein n=1 Tax=Stieleria mannarensis TaxID=2755585 RepID=UPI001600A20F|nr:DnaB-like helicase C-terminal domain-containing protein [Rhodopirellula sp. JC639]